MTMHQPYANYPVYQPQTTPTLTATSSSSFSSSSATSPVSYCTSKDSSTSEDSAVQLSYSSYAVAASKKQPPRKQVRNQYSKHQKETLEQSYLAGMYVSLKRREEMARELRLTAKQVKVWYQNRRQKDKRREGKLKKQEPMMMPQHNVNVIDKCVPLSAESPDSGVQDVIEEERKSQIISDSSYSVTSNKVEAQKSSYYSPPVAYEDKYYSYLAAAATHYSPFDYSQAFANYYNNYNEYLQFPGGGGGAAAYHQYYQLMSGYQSQQQQHQQMHQLQNYSVVDSPQEPQAAYSGY